MTFHYLDLGSASDWSCCEGNFFQPIRSTTSGKEYQIVREKRKESEFYSLPFGQAVASMYQPKSHFSSHSLPKRKKMGEQDCLQFFCNLSCPKGFTCLSGKLRTEFTSLIVRHYFLCTLIVSLS